jgi:hypothetical protein
VAQVAEELHIQQVTSFMENLTLARATSAQNIPNVHVPWEFTGQIA